MKKITLKTLVSIAIVFSLALYCFSLLAPARAGTLNDCYDELAAQFPQFIEDLTANGATEEQIRAFVNDLDAALQDVELTESNFDSCLLSAALEVAGSNEAVLNALGKAYPDAVAELLKGHIPSGFQPPYRVLKKKLLSSEETTPAGGGGGAATEEVPADTEPTADITVTIDGGIFTTADGQAGLIVPEGALTGEATVKIVLTTGPAPDPSMSFAGDVYEFTSSAAFSAPVTVVLKYDPASVADPARLGISYYNATLGRWIFIGGTVDTTAGTVSVTVDHLTKFAVMVKSVAAKLTDVDGHWASKYIDRLVEMGIISGYADGAFLPDKTISRSEFAVIIAKARGLALDSQAALTFSDAAPVPDWARPSIAAAVKAGIISGYEDNTFRPDRLITRVEMASMIVRAMNLSPAASPSLTFADAGDIPAWARGYVATAVDKLIIAGRNDNTFGALDNATRAEAATMVVKMLEALGF